MKRFAFPLSLLSLAFVAQAQAAKVRPAPLYGSYLEARTCDVWAGACFANAEMNLAGKHGTLAWKVEQGEYAGQNLAGLTVIAVVEASDTLGLEQKGAAKAALLIDERATEPQAAALKLLAQRQGGLLTKNIIATHRAPIDLDRKCCEGAGCAKLDAGRFGRVETRCLHEDEDKVCGHEDNFYPPLARGVTAQSAMIVRHLYEGPGFNKSWDDASRRGAYVGTFALGD